jgi:hypothetical protein
MLNAECTEKEKKELVDHKFSKSDITWVCARRDKWIGPLKDMCIKYNGIIDRDGNCEISWSNAKDICHIIGGRLPSLEELKEIVIECGGTYTKFSDTRYRMFIEENMENKDYRLCYTNKGFESYYYWSSETDSNNSNTPLLVGFGAGDESRGDMSVKAYMTCIKSGK